MSDKTGETRKEKDWWTGEEKEVHHDSGGKKIGETRFTKDWLGESKQEHYDAEGRKTGETRKGPSWLGETRAEHYDKDGRRVGYSRDETNWFGESVQKHYDTSWKQVGSTRRSEDWTGAAKKEHEGTWLKASPQANTPEAPSSSCSISSGSYSSAPTQVRRPSGAQAHRRVTTILGGKEEEVHLLNIATLLSFVSTGSLIGSGVGLVFLAKANAGDGLFLFVMAVGVFAIPGFARVVSNSRWDFKSLGPAERSVLERSDVDLIGAAVLSGPLNGLLAFIDIVSYVPSVMAIRRRYRT